MVVHTHTMSKRRGGFIDSVDPVVFALHCIYIFLNPWKLQRIETEKCIGQEHKM